MAKMTAKYSGALEAARRAKLNVGDSNQEQLYAGLQYAGYFWDSNTKQWEYHEPELADEPTPLVMIRVWADAEIIEEAADLIITRLTLKALPKDKIWQLVERSPAYGCRPPKQKEARIYLKFLPQR